MSFIDYSTLIRDVLIDFCSIYFLSYVILYRKFRNIEMFVSSALFNVFIMLIVMAIVRTDFNIAVGFGLFALLSLVQLRSAQFTKTEVAYLFGAVSLGVINGAGISDLGFIVLCNAMVIVSTWLTGSWSLEHSSNLIRVDNVKKMSVTLDHIDQTAISDRTLMNSQLIDKLGIDVQTFEVKKIDYVRDMVELAVVYSLPNTEIAQYTDNVGLETELSSVSSPITDQLD